jgi:hypothetical protein
VTVFKAPASKRLIAVVYSPLLSEITTKIG